MTQWDLAVDLVGTRVRLEPITIDHAETLFPAARPTEIWRWWAFNPARSAESFREWIASCIEGAAAGLRQHFATVAADTGTPIGSTSFCSLNPTHKGIEIGWTWLTPASWRTGANREAKLLMLSHAFEVLGCQRVEFETDALNERSRAAIAALGARFEGIHRDDKIVRDGVRRSSAYYSIIDHEWPVARERIQQQLRTEIARRA